MSRGSTFTLYRKYNKFKIGEDELAKLRNEYYEYNKSSGFLGSLSLYNGDEDKLKKAQEHFEKSCREDMPTVMRLDFTRTHSFSEPEYDTVDEYRNGKFGGYAMSTDRCLMDKLLEWNFNSVFDCLINEYNLSYYNFKNSEMVVDTNLAKEILSAAEYLLNGKYDDTVEQSMNNPFIKILSDGNNCYSYYKYIERKRNAAKKREFTFTDNDNVEVSISLLGKSKDDVETEEDEIYEREIEESNETMECYLRTLANALRAFLESDNWSYGNETELVLVYSCWG